jgi:carboxylesterase type B
MVWFHGGGFGFGSGNTDFYGPDFLLEGDVVLVTVNYRLGPLGKSECSQMNSFATLGEQVLQTIISFTSLFNRPNIPFR